jgi:signal peptidase I
MVLGPLGSLGVVAAPASALTILGAVAFAWVGLWVYAAWDAWRVARAGGPDFTLREYNRWYVYLIVGLLPLPGAASWAMSVRENVVQAFVVPSESMSPTIESRQGVLVDKLAYRIGPVCRGDVVVFRNPNQPYQDYIKRVVALPGDTVELRQDELHVNGAPLEHTVVDPRAGKAPEVFWETSGDVRYSILLTPRVGDHRGGADFPRLRVPSGHCFVLGDHRHHSVDSREFGPVPLRDIVGRVSTIWRPRVARIAGGGCGR